MLLILTPADLAVEAGYQYGSRLKHSGTAAIDPSEAKGHVPHVREFMAGVEFALKGTQSEDFLRDRATPGCSLPQVML